MQTFLTSVAPDSLRDACSGGLIPPFVQHQVGEGSALPLRAALIEAFRSILKPAMLVVLSAATNLFFGPLPQKTSHSSGGAADDSPRRKPWDCESALHPNPLPGGERGDRGTVGEGRVPRAHALG